MEQDYSNVKVGDTVWYSDVNRKGLSETTVIKVGTKLITTERLVFRKDTGCTNDSYAHQFLVIDKDLYIAEQVADAAFRELKNRLGWSRNKGVTYADVKEAARILKIDI